MAAVVAARTRSCLSRQQIRPARAYGFSLRLDARFFQTSPSRARQDPTLSSASSSMPTTTTNPQATHPRIERGGSKVYESADAAIADLKDGATILSAGFGLCGVAETLIQAIHKKGTKNLTVVSNNAGSATHGLALLTKHRQIGRMIMSFLGTNKDLEKQYLGGEVSIELTPQGTLAERLRAGGAGIPAFFTATGVDTNVQTGKIPIRFSTSNRTEKPTIAENGKAKETREFEGRSYIMETALTGDVAILRAAKVDEAGNCMFRYTTQSYAPLMAKAATIAIVEAEEIVPIGTLSSTDINLPGIYIDRIVPATAPKQVEVIKLAPNQEASTSTAPNPNTTTPSSPPKDEAQQKRIRIAKRVAKELKSGYYVNLGVGIPTLSASYLPPSTKVWLQSENGILGMGPYPTTHSLIDPDLVNAGKEPVTLLPGASTFDSAESFAMIRGGHVDVSVLGALQVSSTGDLANYMIPGKMMRGMGGAMDLVSNPGKTKIVVATEHTDKHGRSKIVQKCELPLTGRGVVSTIITELGVFQVDRSGREEGKGGLVLTEVADGVSVEEVKRKTDAEFTVAEDLKVMD